MRLPSSGADVAYVGELNSPTFTSDGAACAGAANARKSASTAPAALTPASGSREHAHASHLGGDVAVGVDGLHADAEAPAFEARRAEVDHAPPVGFERRGGHAVAQGADRRAARLVGAQRDREPVAAADAAQAGDAHGDEAGARA